MSDLEKRLRELKDQVTGASSCDLVIRYIDAAARIGAEVEREECARIATRIDTGRNIAATIRARGNKGGE